MMSLNNVSQSITTIQSLLLHGVVRILRIGVSFLALSIDVQGIDVPNAICHPMTWLLCDGAQHPDEESSGYRPYIFPPVSSSAIRVTRSWVRRA